MNLDNLGGEERRIKIFVIKLNKKITSFRERGKKMIKGIQKLKALYPKLYVTFSTSDRSLEIEGHNFYQQLEDTRNQSHKKYSLYVNNAKKKTAKLTKNKSMNMNIFDEQIPEKKRKSLGLYVEKNEASEKYPKMTLAKMTEKSDSAIVHKKESNNNSQNNANSFKISLISHVQSTNDNKPRELKNNVGSSAKRRTLFVSNNDSKKLSGVHLPLIKKQGNINDSWALSINNQSMIQNLASKSIFLNKKPLNLKGNSLKNGDKPEKEIQTYEELIEKTGQFNIIPNINKHPLYNHFQKQLHRMLGSSINTHDKEAFNKSTFQSNMFEFQIENTNKSIKSEQSVDQGPSQISNKESLHQLDPLKKSSPIVSFLQGSYENQSLNFREYNLKTNVKDYQFYAEQKTNFVIEALKKEDAFWVQIVNDAQILKFVEKFEVKQCELLFLHLVIIFDAELSNKVPKYSEILQKIKGLPVGMSNKIAPRTTRNKKMQARPKSPRV